ncbi:MAG: hypothetical protein QXP39_00880 [Candidatus Aenigmatarchaeota archaeon]
MARERIAAIVIGLLMIGSIVGFAVMSARPITRGQSISPVIERLLTPQEKIQVLRTGRVLIEYIYPSDCNDCEKKAGMYYGFVQRYANFTVLEIVQTNATTTDQLIGIGGQIRELKNITTEDELFAVFCESAIIKPRECLFLTL